MCLFKEQIGNSPRELAKTLRYSFRCCCIVFGCSIVAVAGAASAEGHARSGLELGFERIIGMEAQQTIPTSSPSPTPISVEPQPQPGRPGGAAAADVQSNIQSAIQRDPSLADVNVQVRGKNVELTGTAPSKDAKMEAERIAKENANGMKVKNHLEVKGSNR